MQYLLLLGLLSLTPLAFASGFPAPRSVAVAPDVAVPVTVFGLHQPNLLVWLPSERGVERAELETARRLAPRGYEIWVADLFGARFLPVVPSSLSDIPATDVAGLFAAAAQRHKPIYLLSSGSGVPLALEGARLWQQKGHTIYGAVLLGPNLFKPNLPPGEEPAYLPIASQTSLPVYILQGNLSPWYWYLEPLKQKLESGGSRVIVKELTGMRDRFYFRNDMRPQEQELGQRLDTLIHAGLKQMPAPK